MMKISIICVVLLSLTFLDFSVARNVASGRSQILTFSDNKLTFLSTLETCIIDNCAQVRHECVPGDDVMILANPNDCYGFCKCNFGNAYCIPCPPGLHFNAELRVCDWPASAACQ